jgi:NAD(P)-dependent dehydrogenase (short-subunit alcohol dehydrogenase family)
MTRSWAAESSILGVRVKTVASVPTYAGIQSRDQTAAIGATEIHDRAAEPDEIAEVIGLLASPRAS